MREIKFRAWDNGKMQVVDFNNLFVNRHHPSGTLYLRREMPFGDYHQTKLMQYTGIKDKNGKEIYEGDIVRIHDDKNTNKGWNEEVIIHRACFMAGDENLLINVHFRCEVIGNIYENKEFLAKWEGVKK